MYYYSYTCEKLGSIEDINITRNKVRRLKKNEIRLKILAIGLNYVDYLMIKGSYQYKNKVPFIPGTEASGIIVEHTYAKKNLMNKKVLIHAKNGCFSEEVIVKIHQIQLLNNAIPVLQASCFYSSAITAYVALIEKAKIKEGNVILISGASGGIGQACVELAKYLGAKVICIAGSNKKKVALKKIKADLILLENENIEKPIMEFTNNKGVDIVLDINGHLKYENILRYVIWNGKYLIVGFTDNNITSIKTNYILIKGLEVLGIRAGEYMRRQTNTKRKKILKEIFDLAEKNILITKDYKIKNFDKLKEGLLKIKNRNTNGKIVITTNNYKKFKNE